MFCCAVIDSALDRGQQVVSPTVVQEEHTLTQSPQRRRDRRVAGAQLLRVALRATDVHEALKPSAIDALPPGGVVDWAARRGGRRRNGSFGLPMDAWRKGIDRLI